MDITALRLRDLRQKMNLSQQKIASRLGITRSAYNKYESGVIRPSRKLNELAALFGVSADYILGRDDIPQDVSSQDLSPRDHAQIKKYLSLSEEGKDIVDITLGAVYDREKRHEQ